MEDVSAYNLIILNSHTGQYSLAGDIYTMVSPLPLTIVCCVESGSLESQTRYLVESLRRFGGSLAQAPIIAVTPRLGLPLQAATRQCFDQFEVEHISSLRSPTRYTWNGFMNKPYALLAATERAKTDMIVWLDSDILVAGEPANLLLPDGIDFQACTADQSGATTGPNDEMAAYWEGICQCLGLELESLPWVMTAYEQAKVRFYFNSGVFVYRRLSKFAPQYLENCIRLLDSRLSSKVCSFFYTDQVSLGLTAHQLGLSWQPLPLSHNYSMSSRTHDSWYREEELREARLIHYHDAVWPPFWPTFLSCVQKTHSDVGKWLDAMGPMQNTAPLPYRAINKPLKMMRDWRRSQHQAACTVL